MRRSGPGRNRPARSFVSRQGGGVRAIRSGRPAGETTDATPVHRPRDPGRRREGAVDSSGRAARRALGRSRELPHHPALHRRRRPRDGTRGVRDPGGGAPPRRADRDVRRAGELRRRAAAGGVRAGRADERARRPARRAGAPDPARRPAAGEAPVHPARDPGAVARDLADRRGGLPRRRADHFPKIAFAAARVVLFSARDSVGGGPYVVEAAYPFA